MTFLTFFIAIIMNSSDLTVTSNAFKNNEDIPSQYTCEGANETPTFTISNIPAGTKSLAFIMDDPDAPKGNFDHWVLFNIDANGKTQMTIDKSTPGTKGANGAGENKYTGPCPQPENIIITLKLMRSMQCWMSKKVHQKVMWKEL
jgi:Raf kinase inhibitor-like YbhB/YbcL family protein